MDDNGIIAMAEDIGTDLINKLPYNLLSFIISFLRIRDAVETSMVSRQFKNLWKHPIMTRPNLEFDIPNIFGGKYARLIEKHEEKDYLENLIDKFDRQCFERRVNALLELYSGKKVDSLKVAFFFEIESAAILDDCIRFAIKKGAQSLDLQLFRSKSSEPEPEDVYVFPHKILSELNAINLQHFSLQRCVLQPPADFDRFDKLKTLCLNKVFIDPFFSAHLFSVCVLLESLTLRNCRLLSNLIVGPSLHLKDMKLLGCQLEKVEIDAINLSSLEYYGNILKISHMHTPRLVRFFFRGLYAIFGLPYALIQLASCPRLETLHLQMFYELENIPETFQTFNNLKVVRLDLFMSKFDLWSVLNILCAAPLMEEFILTVRASSYEGEMRDVSGFLHNHLRIVEMRGFQGKWLEIELAKCILKIATKLEEMVIDPIGKYYEGCGTWSNLNVCNYVDGNEYENEDEYVDSDEGTDVGDNENEVDDENVDTLKEGNENEDRDPEEGFEDDVGVDVAVGNKDEGLEVEEGSEQHENEDGEEMNEEDGVVYETYEYSRWEKRGRVIVQERLKEVKTDARITVR